MRARCSRGRATGHKERAPISRRSFDVLPRYDRVGSRAWLQALPPTIRRAQRALLVHRSKEILVCLRGAQLVEQELDRVHRAHRHEDAAQHPHLRERRAVDQQFFLAGARLGDVDRREGALVGDLAVEDDFRVTGALELLEDDLVHAMSNGIVVAKRLILLYIC